MKSRKKLLLGAIEATYGVDPTPTGAAAALVHDMEINPLEGEDVEIPNDTGKPGNKQKLVAGMHAKLTFKVQLTGAGAAGTVPKYGVFLKACGLAEVVTAGVKVEYSPVDENEQSATLYYYHDNQLHKLTGCRGTVKYVFAMNKPAVAEFSFTGLYNEPIVGVQPTPSWNGWIDAKAVANGVTNLTFDGYEANMESFELDHANDVVYHELTEVTTIQITDRKEAGSMVIEAPSVAAKNFWQMATSAEKVDYLLTHGTTAGNIVELKNNEVQIGRPSYGDKNGNTMLNISFSALDKYILTVK